MTADDIIKSIKLLSSGGIDPLKLGEIYETLRPSVNGDFSDDHHKQILKILSTTSTKERNITIEVTEWVDLQDGIMSISDCCRDLGITTKIDKTAVRVVFHRLIGKKIEREGEKSGIYRKIGEGVAEQQWWTAQGKPLNVQFPLGIDQPQIYAGNIILLEGAKSQGKTRFAMEFARLNRNLFKDRIRYQNVEMGNEEILGRVNAYEKDKMWTGEGFRKSVEMLRVTANWHDYILNNSLNIVDYIVEYTEPYKTAQHIFRIHEKLGNGIALIIVQKDPAKVYGSGGYAIRNIPRLIVSLQNHVVKLEDVKSFKVNSPEDKNPSGLSRRYKMPGLWKFYPETGWQTADEVKQEKNSKKYSAFEGFIHED